ncbi:Probable LRR receptor-like serine/threonine-protein kinase At2g24230 [Linum perenne]
MGFGFFTFTLVLTLFFKLSPCQDPNSDESHVSGFFKDMGLASSQLHKFSGPLCSWQGVVCDAENDHVVVGLTASGVGLSGPIPDLTIGKLSSPQSLDLSNNRITALPTDMWGLRSLKSLNLSSNTISGILPNDISNFASLETLDLSGNSFSGEIPPAIRSLLNLRVLKLGGNGFEGRIPVEILSCMSLVVLDLSLNKLNGSLPDGFGAAFPKLESLSLAGNDIDGRDSDFSQLQSLTSLNISGNLFEGSVLGLFLEKLEKWPTLVHLDLSENQLSGEMFGDFSQAQNLKYLNLAFNRFSRKEFPKIDGLSGLEYLNLSKSSLIGNIPPELSKLSNLHTLDLSENHLIGDIPSSLVMKSLHVLDVSRNNMTGEIPSAVLQSLSWMESFNFSYNNFTFCGSEISPENIQNCFYGSLNSCPIAANPGHLRRKATNSKGLKLALALTISMVALLVGLLFLAFGCRRKSRMWPVKQMSSYKEEQNITDSTTWVADVKQANSVGVVIFEKPLLNITFADLLAVTSNFDRGTLLAEGKFGPVYSGFLPGGIHVAVKVLVHGSTLTEQEAARELEYLGRIKHPNLVPLTGYCLAGEQRIAIYDYMENGNLQNLLHDLPLGVQTRTDDWSNDTWEKDDDDNNGGIQNVGSEGLLTTWAFRHKTALGTARALAFLHHGCSPPIIHRDVKASSVYLDYNLEPRLSDFGLAKLFGNGLDEEIARGSPGYCPPEFADPDYDNTPTPKSDVYCYGVILFELISGKKPIDDDYPEEKDGVLVSWVRGLVRKNQSSRAIDPKIRGTGSDRDMEEALKIGYLCTADLPSKRPSMQQVVGLLKDIEPRS